MLLVCVAIFGAAGSPGHYGNCSPPPWGVTASPRTALTRSAAEFEGITLHQTRIKVLWYLYQSDYIPSLSAQTFKNPLSCLEEAITGMQHIDFFPLSSSYLPESFTHLRPIWITHSVLVFCILMRQVSVNASQSFTVSRCLFFVFVGLQTVQLLISIIQSVFILSHTALALV